VRFVYVTVSFPFGSPEAFLADEFAELKRQGHEIRIVPMLPAGQPVHRDASALVGDAIRRPLVSPALVGAVIRCSLRAPRAVGRVLRTLASSRTPAIFAKNLAVLPKAAWLSEVARGWRADHVHAHWGGATATMALVAGELSGIPWSMTLHRWDIDEDNLLREKVRRASFIRFISEQGRQRARRFVPAALLSKTVVVRMGVALPARPRDRSERPTRAAILCVAALTPRKGQCFLLEALAELAGDGIALELWLVGEGESEASLRREADRLAVAPYVRFLGLVPHERLSQLYRDPCVLGVALASLDEGVPVTLIEAMAHGVPVVSTDVGGTPELLRDGAGMLVEPANARALAAALRRLVLEPAFRRDLAQKGRARVEAEYAVVDAAAQLAGLMAGSRRAERT
jgi:colanic acid/amylovoran biosynthesis glycosyltransferase